MSAGCSLDDAFPDTAEKVPKKKRSATKGPALAFLKGVDSDPDRPFVNEIPKESIPKPFAKEGFQNKAKDDPTVDIIGQGPTMDSYGHTVSSYFGKSETDESLSDFSPAVQDKTGYILNSEFPAKLPAPGLELASAAAAAAASANTNNAWKPINPRRAGIETAFFNEKEQGQDNSTETSDLREEHVALRRQIDMLFARLEHMEHRRGEFSHSELGLFILTGLFIMFGLDSVRRFR